jgi:hypothetical protein
LTRPAASDRSGEKIGPTVTVILALFALSRLALYAAGVKFDASGLTWYWQYIEPSLLTDRLFESLWNLHSQPPGFNLALGLALKLSPVHFAALIHGGYIVLGGVATVCLYLLARQLGLSNRVAAAVSILFAVAPATMLYENWLFYEYPAMCLLLLASVLLHRFAATGSRGSGTAFFLVAAVLIYLRSIFQLVWLIPILLALVRVRGARTVAICAAAPMVLILLLYSKNLVMFGVPTTSSWLGMNLSRATVVRLPPETRNELAAAGVLHGVARAGRFAPLEKYAPYLPAPVRTNVPVLDVPVKASGVSNFNHTSYLTVSRELFADSLWVIRHRPLVYLRSIAVSLQTAFLPATDYFAFDTGNRDKIAWYEGAANRWALLAGRWTGGVSVTTLAAYGLAALYAMLVGWQVLRGPMAFDARRLTLLFLAFTAAYVMTVSVTTERGENQRMRFLVDPLVMAIVAVAATRRMRVRDGGDIVT